MNKQFLVRMVISWIVLLIYFPAISQFDSLYVPMGIYQNKEAVELIKKIAAQYDNEISDPEIKQWPDAVKQYKTVKKRFAKQIDQGWFIKDYILDSVLWRVINRLHTNNKMPRAPELALITRSPLSNALCMGEGSFSFTIKLLSSMSNESQLAFVVGHELAHLQLDHVKKRSIRSASVNIRKKVNNENRKISQGKSSISGLEELQDIFYQSGQFSRAMEFQADSLGLIYVINAGYNSRESLTVIDRLNQSEDTWYDIGADIFKPLHSGKYPFQKNWIRDGLGVYHRSGTRSLIFDLDSISTHPLFELRKERLNDYLKKETQSDLIDSSWVNIQELAMFESVEGALFAKSYDRALFFALQLKNKHDHNIYLTNVIARLLLRVVELKRDNLFDNVFSKYTQGYSTSLRQVNNFLRNLNAIEMSEVLFHFLSKAKNFRTDLEEHYYLLYKACEYSGRKDNAREVLNWYLSKFPDGSYRNQMN